MNRQENNEYSLWFMPPKGTSPQIYGDELIDRLAQVHHTSVFPLHVALLDRIRCDEETAREKTREVARRLYRGEVIGSGTLGWEPYSPDRALFTPVAATTDLEIAHIIAEKVFHQAGEYDLAEMYSPQITWVSDKLSEREIAQLLAIMFHDYAHMPSTQFRAHNLHLWNTSGAMSAWYEVERASLLWRI